MGVGTSNKDIILPETEYELQEIFDELNDNISDYSGPDLIEDPDRMSTGIFEG